jgi:hypothetical protein
MLAVTFRFPVAPRTEEFALEVEETFDLIDDDYDAKRAMLDRLGIEVRIAIENDERVAYGSSPVLGDEILPIMDKPSNKVAPTPTLRPSFPPAA